jgi:tRNA1Val (adenine37-N6)-methyltransferase
MSEAREKPFCFKQFEVLQTRCAMKIGTDAVLLGAWVSLSKHEFILDVGTGSGVIALICAQRNPVATIHGIDIHEDSILDAQHNFERSPWSNRLHAHRGDFLKMRSAQHFDLIVSNPPFFSQSLHGADPDRNVARHDDLLPADAFVSQAAQLLSAEGELALIIPHSELERWLSVASLNGFLLSRLCYVCSTPDKAPNRILIQWSRIPATCVEERLVIRQSSGDFSEEYKSLTRALYLKF